MYRYFANQSLPDIILLDSMQRMRCHEVLEAVKAKETCKAQEAAWKCESLEAAGK
jgi:hypothetical protein